MPAAVSDYKNVNEDILLWNRNILKNIILSYLVDMNKYTLNNKDGIIPVEVKAGDNTQSKSLNIYKEKYNPKYSIRISTKNFEFAKCIKSIPLYAAFCIK